MPTILNLPSKVTIDDDRQVGKQDGAELIFFILEIAIVYVIPMRLCFPSTWLFFIIEMFLKLFGISLSVFH